MDEPRVDARTKAITAGRFRRGWSGWRPRRAGRWAGALLAVWIGLGASVSAGAAAATPQATAVAAALDLPAMSLRPSDAGAGFGLYSGQFYTLADEAQGDSQSHGGSAASWRAKLTAAGWQSEYDETLALPAQADNPGLGAARAVLSYALSLASAAGAQTLFAQTESRVAGAAAVKGAKSVGDESKIYRYAAIQNTRGQTVDSLDLEFRVQSTLAGVTITDYTGTEPTVAAIEALAQTALAHVTAVRAHGGPGLSFQTLTLKAASANQRVSAADGYYGRLNGRGSSYFGEPASVTKAEQTLDAKASSRFDLFQTIATAADPNGAGFSVQVLRFADAAAAKAFVVQAPANYAKAYFPGVATKAVAHVAALGSATAAITFTGPTGATGVAFFAAVGDEAAAMEANAGNGAAAAVAVAVVQQLMAAQVACLQIAGPCAPVPAPAGLS